MSNILNSHIINNNNVVPANPLNKSKTKNSSSTIVAPVKLPEYSINKKLNEKDEFRKATLQGLQQTKKKKERTNSFFKTLLLVAATVVSYKYFKGKV